jgi:hypothetical protein
MKSTLLVLAALVSVCGCDTPRTHYSSAARAIDHSCLRACKQQREFCYNNGVDNNCHGMKISDFTKCTLAYSMSCSITDGQCEAGCR